MTGTRKNNMKITEKVKKMLADYIGAEVEDIKDEDFLVDDLHMSATEITDFIESLDSAGIDVSKIDIAELEAVEDLIESISSEEL